MRKLKFNSLMTDVKKKKNKEGKKERKRKKKAHYICPQGEKSIIS